MLARAVYPVVRNIRVVATGGIVAVPTNQPIIFIIINGRGGACPAPYRAMIFVAP